MDEALILVGLRNRDMEAFNMLFDTLYPQVRFYSEQITKDEFEAEDIAIHAIATFWEKGAEHFETYLQIRVYIFTVARNAAFNFLEKSKVKRAHQKHLSYITPETDENIAERSLYKVEMLQALLDEIEKLPDQCREVFKYVFLEKMPRTLVAEKLHISLSTVHGHCANAKNRLRQIFTEKELIILLLIIGLCHN